MQSTCFASFDSSPDLLFVNRVYHTSQPTDIYFSSDGTKLFDGRSVLDLQTGAYRGLVSGGAPTPDFSATFKRAWHYESFSGGHPTIFRSNLFSPGLADFEASPDADFEVNVSGNRMFTVNRKTEFGSLRVYSLLEYTTGAELYRLIPDREDSEQITEATFSSSGQSVYEVHRTWPFGWIEQRNASDRALVRKLPFSLDTLVAGLDDNGLVLGMSSFDPTKYLVVDLQNSKTVCSLPKPPGSFQLIDSTRVLAASYATGSISLYSLATGAHIRDIPTNFASAASLSYDGSLLATVEGGYLRLRSAETGDEIRSLSTPRNSPLLVSANVTGTAYATYDDVHGLNIYDPFTGKVKAHRETFQGTPVNISLSNDERYLGVCFDLNSNLPYAWIIYDIAADKVIFENTEDYREKIRIEFSPDGDHFALTQGSTEITGDRTSRIYRLSNLGTRQSYVGNALSFSADGASFVISRPNPTDSFYQTVLICSLETGSVRQQFQVPVVPPMTLEWQVLSPNGKTYAYTSRYPTGWGIDFHGGFVSLANPDTSTTIDSRQILFSADSRHFFSRPSKPQGNFVYPDFLSGQVNGGSLFGGKADFAYYSDYRYLTTGGAHGKYLSPIAGGALLGQYDDDTIAIFRGPGSFGGIVKLSESKSDPAGKAVSVEFFDPKTGQLSKAVSSRLFSNGKVAVNPGIEDGLYDVRITVKHFLSKMLRSASLPTKNGDQVYALVNGDVDGDNAITVFDYSLLSDFYGEKESNAEWTVKNSEGFAPVDADLDEDGTVGFRDYEILSANFDKAGE